MKIVDIRDRDAISSSRGRSLGTSCNVSGDPDGSIVDLDRAIAWAR